MTTEIIAQGISFADEEGHTLLAFADDPNEPHRILMLAYTIEPDEQDLRLGLGGVHIDTGEDLRIIGYDLVADVVRTDRGILVQLKPGVGQDIEVLFDGDAIDDVPVSEIIDGFRRRLTAPDRKPDALVM